ncbi:MAG: lipoate--protein ligase family protein [Planctomycetes bacterium]|nr:lipoate--protein ligase family protein [Planctomycetota bacterium]
MKDLVDPLVIRVVQDPPLDGPTNMARDEALLTRVGQGESPPTLRLYQWALPTISLGYFQRFDDFCSSEPVIARLPVVRRTTGGGAILHDWELTYSLTLPLDHPLLDGGPNCLYEKAHDAIIECLREYGVHAHRGGASDGESHAARGPFFCFARRHCLDVLVGDRKIAGSAQRRTKSAVLQHGSIILGSRFAQHPVAIIDVDPEQAIRRFRDQFPTTLSRLTGQSFDSGQWTPEEQSSADTLRDKYASDLWTRRM